MPRREEPGYTIERLAEVVTASFFGCANVQGHAHPDRSGWVGPFFPGEGVLGFKGSLQALRSGGEGSTESITYTLEDIASISLNSSAQDLIMAGEGSAHLPGVLLPALS